MYSQQNVGIGDDYVTAHRLDRRLAVIDRFYLTNVTNRAFNDYFGNTSYGCLTEFVHPDDKERFKRSGMLFLASMKGRKT